MFRPRAHRLLPALRIVLTMLLALGMMLQPAIASVSEIHELAHDPTGSHLQIGDGDLTARESAGQDKEAGAGTLHILLDFAHCCGQHATTFSIQQILPLIPGTMRPPMAIQRLPLESHVLVPHRPPIA